MDFHQQVERPKYNPFLMALSNVIIMGAAYLVMHLYARFFITYALMFVIVIGGAFFPGIGLLALILGLVVLIDTFVQAKGITSGAKPVPVKRGALHIFGIIVIALFIIVYVGIRSLNQTRNPYTDRNALQEIGRDVQTRRESAAIVERYQPLTDARCEGFANDSTLRYESNGNTSSTNYLFQEYCYFKKAVDTGNRLYCGTLAGRKVTSSYEFDPDCITYLAVKNRRPELCTEMLERTAAQNCAEKYTAGIASYRYVCRANWPKHIQERCEAEFGAPVPPIGL